jgi:hypothetical protein
VNSPGLIKRLSPYFKTRPRDPATGRPVNPPASETAAIPAAAATQQPGKGRRARKAAKAARSAPTPPAATPQGSRPPGRQELVERREALSRKFAELQWDLGGLAYEMALRDGFRADLLARRAAELKAVEAELGSIERLLHTEQAGAAGSCAKCGALYARGAVYCSQCGASLTPQPAAGPQQEQRPPIREVEAR